MEKRIPALDPEALRSFVEGIDAASFAQAAEKLSRSTSAVSAHLKKLEQQCGAPLTAKKGRKLVLTPAGEILLSYARRLLALNDEALRAVRGELLQGEVRVGMQEDFGESLMPRVLGQFNRQHTGLRITARIDRNAPLLQALEAGALDLALIWQDKAEETTVRREPLLWVCRDPEQVAELLQRDEPLPLVMFDAPCLFRRQAVAALEAAGISWRVAFTSHSLNGLWAGVQAGLGVTLRTRIGLPEGLHTAGRALPQAGALNMGLHMASPTPGAAVEGMRQAILTALNE